MPAAASPGRSAAVLAALVVAIPLASVPYAHRPFTANQLSLFIIYGLLAMSLALVWGGAGIMSFGQTAFFGIGGYAYGIVGLNLIRTSGESHLALVVGLLPATNLSALVRYFMFYGHVSDVYASIITMALTLVLFTFFMSTGGDEWVIGVARIGGFNGLFGQGTSSQNIANFQIPPVTVWLPGMAEPFRFVINRETVSGYYLVVTVSALLLLGATLLLHTRVGRVMVAIRENEARAATLGYDIRFYKLLVFTLGGGIAGVAGILFAAWGRFVNPDRFGLGFAAGVVVYVLLGGRTSLIGSFVGAAALGYLTTYLGEVVPFSSAPGAPGTWAALGAEALRRVLREAPVLVQGFVLVGAVLLLHDGVAPPALRLLRRYERLGWLVLLPASLLYLGERVACRQLDRCLY
jgi:branched-chain amino acid transport system permease protein